jgi:hypothetical protein
MKTVFRGEFMTTLIRHHHLFDSMCGVVAGECQRLPQYRAVSILASFEVNPSCEGTRTKQVSGLGTFAPQPRVCLGSPPDLPSLPAGVVVYYVRLRIIVSGSLRSARFGISSRYIET